MALPFGQVVGLAVRGDLRPLQHHGDHQPGQQRAHDVGHVPVGVGRQLPHQAGVQGGLLQGGFQVDDTGVLVLVKAPHVGAGGQDQGAGQSEVGEQQLTQLTVYYFTFPVLHRQDHVFQGQALHLPAAGVGRLQRHQRRGRLHNSVPRLAGQVIAVPRGAGGGIGRPAGGQDQGAAGELPLVGDKGGHFPLFCFQAGGPGLDHGDLQPPQLEKQRVDDVGGLVGGGEHPVTPLYLQLHPQVGEKALHIGGGGAAHGAEQKAAVPGGGGQGLLRGAVVGHVAAALAGDVQLAPHLLVALHQAHVRPQSGGGDGGHHPGGAAAHHDQIMLPRHSCTFSYTP